MKPDYKKILEGIADGVYYVNRDRKILYWNKGAEKITGFSSDKVVGHFCHDNILNHVTGNGRPLCFNGCPLHATIQDGRPREAEIYLHHRAGHRLPVVVRTSPIRNKDGEIIGAVETFSNNSSSIRKSDRIHRLEDFAHRDPLTQIFNRRYAEIKLQSAWDEFIQHNIPFGVVFMDIDDFKKVNDQYGHDVGDQILKVVSQTMVENIRREDLVSRWGGEEFLLVLHNTNLTGLKSIARKLRQLIRHSYIQRSGQKINVTVSVGATLAKKGDTVNSLMDRSDRLMYQSKQAGKDRVIIG